MDIAYIRELLEIPEMQLAAALGVSPQVARARRKAVIGLHADATWIRRQVDDLPPEALAVVQLVATRGGLLGRTQLDATARAQFAMPHEDVERGLAALANQLLAVELSEYGYAAVTLVAPSALLLAAAIAGMEIPPLPTAPFVAGECVDHRIFLAVCTAAAHIELKVTRAGEPHMATTKRLAKQVGADEDVVRRALLWGERLGLLHAVEQRWCCDTHALRTVATAVYDHDPVLAEIAAALQRAPAPLRDVERWVHASSVQCMCENLGLLPSLQVGTVGGQPAVSWRPPSGAATSYVTPSFEVFVPPEARLLDIVEVGLCATWTRLDTVLVARVTKASIVNAVRLGATGPDIVAALTGVSKHALPQNVEVGILDWASGVVAAAVAHGTVVTVDPAATDQVVRALKSHKAKKLAPGVIFVEGGDNDPAIERALKAADLLVPSSAPSKRPRPTPTGAIELPGPSAVVRRRFTEWLAARPPAPPERKAEPSRSNAGLTPEVLDKMRGKGDLATIMRLVAARRPGADLDALDALDDLDDLDSDEPTWRVRAWHTDNILVRCNDAALARSALAVRWSGDELPIQVDNVVQRGTTWMLLGEDLETHEKVAIRIAEIRACGELVSIEPSQPEPSKPIAGHLPCPCGSGKRYRACCRPAGA